MKLFSKLFGGNDREVKRYLPVVERDQRPRTRVRRRSPTTSCAAKTAEFRARLADGETLDDLLPEAFAVVREAASGKVGQRHFDVQLIGGIVLHQGKIAELKTGEGKTLVADARRST